MLTSLAQEAKAKSASKKKYIFFIIQLSNLVDLSFVFTVVVHITLIVFAEIIVEVSAQPILFQVGA